MHPTLDQIIAHARNIVTSSSHVTKCKVRVHLVQQQMTNSIAYVYKPLCNIVTFRKRWKISLLASLLHAYYFLHFHVASFGYYLQAPLYHCYPAAL